ncbi:MAG: Methyltransferase [Promethearchaeota archaeon]|nr:MAG: Methyltransferase [Candidatus Lokiarchaeota archaeon]
MKEERNNNTEKKSIIGTSTSSFGVSKRENHDSSKFYNSNLYKEMIRPQKVQFVDNSNEISKDVLNRIILGNSEDMKEIPNNSVHLMITSPPYNVSKEYDDDLTLTEYLTMLKNVFQETWRVLVPGGRVAINIANIGRKPYIPLHAYIIEIMHSIGFHMRGEIIWNKGASAGISCAWGSFASASNPCIRDVHEYILVFSKLTNKLEKGEKKTSITNEDFVKCSKSVWQFSAASAKRVGHPAPFPEELPKRLIEFYSYIGDVILDPFVGSGTTAIAAYQLKRNYIGYDIAEEYVKLANKRLLEYKKTQKSIKDYV